MIKINELAGWCRRVSLSLNAGIDIVTVLEREAGKHAHRTTYVPSPSTKTPSAPPITPSAYSSVPAPPVQIVDSDIDETDKYESQKFFDQVRKREEAFLEQQLNRPRKPPVFLYSNPKKIWAYVADRIRSGASLYEAFSEVKGHFPKLFVPMMAVAEMSGTLGETFGELAKYFEYQLKMKREFWQMMIYPIFQLGASFFIINLLIIILSVFERSVHLFGIEFFGVLGALYFDFLFFFCVFAVMAIYYFFKYYFTTGNYLFHLFLNPIPKIGTAFRCFAMERFTWALHFTTKTGMDIREAMILAFETAAYGPITSQLKYVLEKLEAGFPLSEAFPINTALNHEFHSYLQTGEQAGELPETMARLSHEYNERSKLLMKQLSIAFYFVVFFIVAGILASMIFSLYNSIYGGYLNDSLNLY
ncbi:MAG: type II secretion system F family protein [Planctomycetaceae bacterium]|jgi:type II secretory pathway component PulF|nr:type II secretion system F family protein [Planctomycetaceae bacterium]